MPNFLPINLMLSKNCFYYLITSSLWNILPQIRLKESPSTCFRIKCYITSFEMSKRLHFTLISLPRFHLPQAIRRDLSQPAEFQEETTVGCWYFADCSLQVYRCGLQVEDCCGTSDFSTSCNLSFWAVKINLPQKRQLSLCSKTYSWTIGATDYTWVVSHMWP